MIGVRDELAKYGPYQVGRWARGGPAPDRCYWCPLADIKPAVGVVSSKDRGVLWSYGYCQEHEGEARAWAEGGIP
jgi:hypothetical protein